MQLRSLPRNKSLIYGAPWHIVARRLEHTPGSKKDERRDRRKPRERTLRCRSSHFFVFVDDPLETRQILRPPAPARHSRGLRRFRSDPEGRRPQGRGDRHPGEHVRPVEFPQGHFVADVGPRGLFGETDLQAVFFEEPFFKRDDQRGAVGERDEAEPQRLDLRRVAGSGEKTARERRQAGEQNPEPRAWRARRRAAPLLAPASEDGSRRRWRDPGDRGSVSAREVFPSTL